MDEIKRISESLNPYKTLNLKSKLGINGMDKLMNTSRIIQDMESRHNIAAYNSGITKGLPKDYHDSWERAIKPNTSMFESSAAVDYINTINEMKRTFESIRNSPILDVASTMTIWQSNMESIANNYNSMVSETLKSATMAISELARNMGDFSSLKSFNFDILLPELDKLRAFEFDEELEEEMDLQQVESIVNSKISNILNTATQADNIIVYIINKLIEELVQLNLVANISISDNLISNIILRLIAWLLLTAITYYTSNMVITIKDNKNKIKVIKKELKTMEIYRDILYPHFRIVAKDELKVRISNKMKSGVKDSLSFGDLVQVEHKNKNWTKISYTNAYTDERKIGWVLTRYIKRLD